MSDGERALRIALGPLARRDLAARMSVGAAAGGVLGCAVAALLGHPAWIAACAGLGAVICGARRSSPSALARRVDAMCDTADAVACAWDHREVGGAMVHAQRARALRLVAQVPPAQVVRSPSLAWWAAVPLMVAGWLLTSSAQAPVNGQDAAAPRLAVGGSSAAHSQAPVAQTMPPVAEALAEGQGEAGGPAPPTGALRVGASAPGGPAPDAGASGLDAPSELPSMARAGIGQQAAELAGERAEALERAPAPGGGGQGDTLPLTLGAGSGERPRREGGKATDGPRALLPGDDAWAPPERAHPPRWRAVVARYFATAGASTSTQGGLDGKRGE